MKIQWRIETINLKHNHSPLVTPRSALQLPPTSDNKNEVGKLVKASLTSAQICSVLNDRVDAHPLGHCQVRNLVASIKCSACQEIDNMSGDIAAILQSLQEKSLNDPGWRYSISVDEQTNIVNAIFWQSPAQVHLAHSYDDILINDNSHHHVNCGYLLNIGVGLDGFHKACNLFYCVQEREDAATFCWVLHNFLAGVESPPEIFISDRDEALISTVAEEILCKKYGQFLEPYLEQEIYASWEHWASAWVSTVFTCGVYTNGHVEVENQWTKLLGGPRTSLKQLFDALCKRTETQSEQNDSHVHQMELSMLYKTKVLQKPEGIKN
ncbi:hypothetical protein ARMGADRAFT_1038856 [Armillaria gallica]|uniref:MULE transposase domain-containing protein n=1 Tax=Armillaria gallica TaxID=47427 RepID=A0A2H3CG98_ARMGA|nr:hypothetical protein ARMGADRAFT_1038856 [Armillaria gallica]